MPQKIYFRGAGLITATGDSIDETLAAIHNRQFQPSSIPIELSSGNITVPYFTINNPGIHTGSDRLYQIIDQVVEQAIADSGLTTEEFKYSGLFVGSTSFDIFAVETTLKSTSADNQKTSLQLHSLNHLTNYIKQRFAINGPAYTYNTACTSSANALIYASEFIRRGDLNNALVIGLEFYNELTALGFSSLELISNSSMRPFDKQRDGLHLGEGCGALVISATEKQDSFYYLAGANIGDHYSITASNPEGTIAQQVIERALLQAKLDKTDISLIKAHGTASLSNDEAESAGLGKVFGNTAPAIVALKPLIGHTLGACGINELILFYQSLQQKSLIGFNSNISDEFPLRFATDEDIPDSGHYLLNYFGFGGNSSALVIGNA